jgi:IS66 C-terminal element
MGVSGSPGTDHAAAMTTLVSTAKLNDVDPLAWLAEVARRIADLPQCRPHKLPPWTWKSLHRSTKASSKTKPRQDWRG